MSDKFGYYTNEGYMGFVGDGKGNYGIDANFMLFATEAEYRDYISNQEESDS